MAIHIILSPCLDSAAFVCFTEPVDLVIEHKGLSITYQHQKSNLKAIRSLELIFLWFEHYFTVEKRYYMCFLFSFTFGYFIVIQK